MERTLTDNPARALWMPASLRPPRRLGTDLPAPRTANLVYLPAVMLVVGLWCYLSPTDLLLITGALTLSAVALYLLYSMMLKDGAFRFSTLFVFALCFGYGLGTATTWFSLPRNGMDLAIFLRKDPVVVTHGMGGVLLALSLVLSLGELMERPVFGRDFELKFPPQAILFLLFGTAVMLLGYKTGAIGFQGGQVENGRVGIFTSFIVWLIDPLFAMTLATALNAPTRLQRRGLGALFALQFLLMVPAGRRNQLFAIIMAAFAVRLGRFRVKWSIARQVITVGLIMAFLYVSTLAFFYLRIAGWSVHKTDLSLSDRLSAAVDYFEKTPFSEVQKQYSTNVQSRSFVLGFVSEVQDYSIRFTPGFGYDLWRGFEEAIPSVILPTKENYDEEGIANQLFGSTYIDEANSVMTTGAIDFGLVGMIVYPLLFAFLFRTAAEFFGDVLPTYIACFVVVQMVGSLIEPEQSITDYFTTLRNALLFGNVIWFFLSLPLFRLRKEV